MGRVTPHKLWPQANAQLGARPRMGRVTPHKLWPQANAQLGARPRMGRVTPHKLWPQANALEQPTSVEESDETSRRAIRVRCNEIGSSIDPDRRTR
jgi:hypothetical protein